MLYSEKVIRCVSAAEHHFYSFQLQIEWSDGHASKYNTKWLRNRAFREEGINLRRLMAKGPRKILWGSEHQNEIKYHNYKTIISQPQAMYDWINGNV